tara:strand:+ start:429 stop:2114 length:1686 start_codon:yes stop_codon:yes gene_type:complete
MFLAILTLITALAISAVAIYYSVAGLVAIFAAAAVPIMIMGGVLEIGKLVTAVWLHKYWKQAAWWLRTYLSVAVFVLMLITSMGIFGFLSKAHIEQTSAGEESIARVETIQNEIDRQLGIVGRAENRVRQLESSEIGADENVQGQIDKEQDRIDTAYDRIKPAIAEQNNIIAGVTQLFQNELDKIDADLTTLQGYVDNGEIKKAQQMIGASADGIFGKKTAEKIGDWKEAKQAERAEWLTKIQDAANSPTVQAARKEIARLRDNADRQIEQSNLLINRLRDQLGDTSNQEEIQKNIDEQLERVRTASSEIETLTEEKIGLESEYRKLEAEVGPIKYIAEFVYGEKADNNMLEEAVRWVIIIIIFVFDPLAVLLLIASQYTFEFRRKQLQDDNGERLRLERQEFERARAQAIVDNVPPNYDPITAPEEEATVEETEEPQYEDVDQETLDNEFNEEPQKKSLEYSEELKEIRVKELDEQEEDKTWSDAKQSWKDDNPNQTLKFFKQLYINGKIDELPWAGYVESKDFISKEGSVQKKKETQEGYIQNEEQKNGSIWNTIKNSK